MQNLETEITFETAIATTHTLLQQLEQDQLSQADFAAQVERLVATRDGARGFFVAFLTDPREFAAQMGTEFIQALRTSPHVVVEVIVKTIAMATGMAIQHRRNGDEEQAQGSDRVQRQTSNLILRLQLPELTTELHQLLTTLQSGTGTYQDFVERWQYDPQQQQVMISVLEPLLAQVTHT